jgi:hypothetical protein
LTIDGYQIAAFTELLELVTEIRANAVTGGEEVVRVATQSVQASVTLRRPSDGALDLYQWAEAAAQGAAGTSRRSCSLVAYDSTGRIVSRL